MIRAFIAGTIYCLLVFLLALPLGPVRAFFVTPEIGATPSALLELLIVLPVAWLLCGLLLRWFKVPPTRAARGLMGFVTFAGMMIGDGIISHVMGRSLSLHMAGFAVLQEQIGLLGHLAVAAFPSLRRR